MRIDFLGIEAFLSIANCGSFHGAAGHLNLSQTALSHRLKKLEDDLGVKLLSRSTRQVSLTPAGLELLPTAQKILDEISHTLDALRRQGKNLQERLAIGCLPTIAIHHLPEVLRQFKKMHPDIAVRVFDNSVAELVERVRAREAEFAITIVSASRWDMSITPLLKEPFVLVCPSKHPLASRSSVDWSELDDVPLIRISTQTGNRFLIDDALGARRENMAWRYEVQHVATAIGMVAAGVGATVVPKLGVAVARQAGVTTVPLRNPSITGTLGIIAQRGQPLSPAADALARLVKSHFRKLVA
jgi:DNA-binding transcriptional LysR family regulator